MPGPPRRGGLGDLQAAGSLFLGAEIRCGRCTSRPVRRGRCAGLLPAARLHVLSDRWDVRAKMRRVYQRRVRHGHLPRPTIFASRCPNSAPSAFAYGCAAATRSERCSADDWTREHWFATRGERDDRLAEMSAATSISGRATRLRWISRPSIPDLPRDRRRLRGPPSRASCCVTKRYTGLTVCAHAVARAERRARMARCRAVSRSGTVRALVLEQVTQVVVGQRAKDASAHPGPQCSWKSSSVGRPSAPTSQFGSLARSLWTMPAAWVRRSSRSARGTHGRQRPRRAAAACPEPTSAPAAGPSQDNSRGTPGRPRSSVKARASRAARRRASQRSLRPRRSCRVRRNLQGRRRARARG